MLPPTPLSLLCAILLCLPLAVIFTFTSPSAVPSGGAATPPLPLATPSPNLTIRIPSTISLPPRKTPLTERKIRNQTAAHKSRVLAPPLEVNTTSPPPPPPPPLPPIPAEDEEDRSLFKLASRVNPNPTTRQPKKLAFMFLTTSPLPFAPLWELFFSRAAAKLYNVYVHADPRVNCTAAFRGVFRHRVVASKPTRRHTPTLITAARRLLAHALLEDGSNSMFALLSPSCIPIHSFNYTYRTLMKSRRSFVEILKNEPGAYDRWAARGEQAMSPEVEFEDFRIGSQFWVVKRRHARIIVRDRRLWSKFMLPCLNDDACYPEEHYFPTLLSTVDPRGCVPCTLTHVDWNGSHGGHPRMYRRGEVGPELIWALRKARPRYGDEHPDGPNTSVSVRRRHEPFLFARKFEPGSLRSLIKMANNVIFKD